MFTPKLIQLGKDLQKQTLEADLDLKDLEFKLLEA